MILTHLVLLQFLPGAAKGAAPPPPVTTTRRPGYRDERARVWRDDQEFLAVLAGAVALLDD